MVWLNVCIERDVSHGQQAQVRKRQHGQKPSLAEVTLAVLGAALHLLQPDCRSEEIKTRQTKGVEKERKAQSAEFVISVVHVALLLSLPTLSLFVAGSPLVTAA